MIDFTNTDFTFISREGEYYSEGTTVILESDCSSWKDDTKIKSGWGFFRGYTTEYSKDVTLPQLDGDSSSFEEFDIYYKTHLISELTYGELKNLILSEERQVRLEELES